MRPCAQYGFWKALDAMPRHCVPSKEKESPNSWAAAHGVSLPWAGEGRSRGEKENRKARGEERRGENRTGEGRIAEEGSEEVRRIKGEEEEVERRRGRGSRREGRRREMLQTPKSNTWAAACAHMCSGPLCPTRHETSEPKPQGFV